MEREQRNKLRKQLRAYYKVLPWITLKELLLIVLSTIPYALTVNQLLVPHAVVGGGVTGLCEIIYFATDTYMPIWLSSLLINVVLLVIAALTVGWRYAIRIVWGVLWLTIWLKVVPIATVPLLTDAFMAVVIGGLFTGCFLGICFLNNGSTGGTDVVAMIVNKYHHLPMGRVLLFADMIVISSAFFLPTIQAAGMQGAIEKILFGLTYTFMCSTAVDWVMNRMRQSVQFMIFTQKPEEIAQAIITQAHRGCTFLEAEGGYNKKPMKVVTTIARSYESATIFRLVRAIDPNAFVSQSQVRGVFGQGFDPVSSGR
ncbi:MAG: YitT family protein [Paludibacteraceae bacterium]|nr:YitT family protein [Paludibacteraceae bacterium]